ncbi:unnamed protein product [marine sediment metagenome]|uniref:Uncharacterized protein n=1 Tax=marine sediment metagenome TaxID=412755 RepID=X1EK57_9ZZZZ
MMTQIYDTSDNGLINWKNPGIPDDASDIDIPDSAEKLITKWENDIENKLRWEELPLLNSTQVVSRTVSQELVTVQPMSMPSQGLLHLDYVYRMNQSCIKENE